MNLIIDIGNTQAKIAVFEHHTLIEQYTVSTSELFQKVKKIFEIHTINRAILSSVNHVDPNLVTYLEQQCSCTLLDSQTPLPFKNLYQTPKTLGVDRIALMAAAVTQYPNKNVLVIDAGSCITYDFISAAKEYYGGSISPGIDMRYKAMHQHTAKLPLLNKIESIPVLGNSTQNAMHIGVLQGVICEIEGVVAHYCVKNTNLTVVLTGGNAKFLAKNLKSPIFANPNFLLEGLNSILTYKIDE